MKLQTRLLAYSAVLTLWTVSGILYGFSEIKWWGIWATLLFVGYEVVNYFVIKRRKP